MLHPTDKQSMQDGNNTNTDSAKSATRVSVSNTTILPDNNMKDLSPEIGQGDTKKAQTMDSNEGRIHDFPTPFLVRTKTNQEKEQMRSEYHLQQQQRQRSEPLPQLARVTTGESSKNRQPFIGWIYRGYQKLSASILLENKASVARDHLANERTFLAWLRTSLALITVGVAITQLYHLNPSASGQHQMTGRALGATFVALSIVFLYFANVRYFHSQYALTQGHFPASRGAVLLGSICVLSVLLAMFIVIVTEGS